MTQFRFSKRSRDNLRGLDEGLIAVANLAIQITRIDFGVIEGRRTMERQRELVAAGASQTMNSRHLTGEAFDVMAFVGNRGSWEANLYPPIADAMKAAAQELGVPIKWGGAWTVPDIRYWEDSMNDAMHHYADTRRSQGRRPFLDLGHYELS